VIDLKIKNPYFRHTVKKNLSGVKHEEYNNRKWVYIRYNFNLWP